METVSKKITVNMNKKALTEFVLKSYYCKFSGIMSIFLGLGGLAFLIWNIMSDYPTMRNILSLPFHLQNQFCKHQNDIKEACLHHILSKW